MRSAEVNDDHRLPDTCSSPLAIEKADEHIITDEYSAGEQPLHSDWPICEC